MISKNEIKYIQSLSHKQSRQEHGQFIAEGPKIIGDILQEKPLDIVVLYVTKQAIEAGDLNIPPIIDTRIIEQFELQKISALKTPQQMLALVKITPTTFSLPQNGAWHLLLDGIQDPGNIGSILRTADWFGIQTIYCTPDTADVYNPKVVQAAMGSLGRVAVHYTPCTNWLPAATPNIPVYGTMLNGNSVFAKHNAIPGIIIIGNEGRGIRPNILPFVSEAITIPRIGHAESLNAAVATGIVLAGLLQPA